MIHYATAIRRIGSLEDYCTLRFEGKHTFFKTAQRTSHNYKNVPKTLAKQQMKLAILEAQKKEYKELYSKFEKAPKPEITLAEISDLPLITQRIYQREVEEGKGVSFTYFKMGDVIYNQNNNYNYNEGKYIPSTRPDNRTIEQITLMWISERVKEAGGVNPRELYDLKNRVARQKRKVEQMLKTPSMEDGGTTDDFDWESLFNPSKEEQEIIKQDVIKSEEQEKEDWYQNSRFSKKWATTYKDAVNKTVKEYLDAKATYEDWGSRQYKSNKGVVYAGGDDIHGNAYTIGGINEYRRKKTMDGAKMLMGESIETLKELRLTDDEIYNLLQNKMETGGNIEDEKKKLKLEILKLTGKSFKMFSGSPNQKKVVQEISELREKLDKIGGKFEEGGITESHEDLESRIMKQQFGK
jgi:hypothetical protein